MQGSTQVHNVRFNRHEDFYTTLLRIGYTALTAASEAVFLNEGKGVVARNMTWLEEDRLTEIEFSRQTYRFGQTRNTRAQDTLFETESMNFDISHAPSEWESGYGREKKIEKPRNGSRSLRSHTDPGGVGAFRDKLLGKLGIAARPQWLKKIVGPRRKNTQEKRSGSTTESLDFWILTDNDELELPDNHEFDVEKEMRKRERSNTINWAQDDERRLDEKLYSWWKAGGSWGNQDHSADYVPSIRDMDDTTSVISTSTNDSVWEDESDGRRTPTLANPFPAGFSRESSPAQESLMDVGSFTRLLDPRDQESREEARILAAHLSAGQEGRILTRRQFQQQVERERAQILLSSKLPQLRAGAQSDGKRRPTIEDESEILEKLILSRRSQASPSNGQTWESGASGLGPSGPPCVTCRQEVGGFVRLWVP
ncbi:hypothetical protein EYZ11_001863 [Aspergillus tanneri]|uniref:Uncharacterized protein n=1 Tax=Aspergillus tanneri TaxID=1220188 RepID=A0A4S3JSZ7_9EURO|nr:hypothetical protein EYZ11_001863 [Aspergillus tanneri]